ncbi:alanine racemase [bacterium]|nr:alanine racemase [bacterium]
MKTPSSRLSRLLKNKSDASAHERIRAQLEASSLVSNFRVIQKLSPGLDVLPMLKAEAYGHGAVWAARNLVAESGLDGFGVATLEEGRQLREELGSRARRIRLVVFSGAAHWSEEKGQFCEKFGLTPVIASQEDWDRFFSQGWPSRIPYELKFNTGMNRLGIHPGQARRIVRQLASLSSEWHPQGVFSHLASGEDPDCSLSRTQMERFLNVRSEFEETLGQVRFHLGNSAAIWNAQKWRLRDLTDLVRPGISLYGVPPWKSAPAKGLQPVMTLEAKVISIFQLKAGESVGYGGRFRVSSNTSARIATLAGGYADGIHRGLYEKGSVWLGGRLNRFAGIISMDLSSIECPPQAQVGDWAQILGPHIDIWEQSAKIGSVPYELLTSVSSRVQRDYV